VSVVGAFLSVKGRARRRIFWLITILASLIAMLAGFVAGVAGLDPALNAAISAVISVTLSLPVTIRRGHDRNRPAWWTLMLYALVEFGVLFMTSDAFSRWDVVIPNSELSTGTFVMLAVLIAGGLLLADYGVNPGKPETNRYGPPPPGSPREIYG